MGSRWVQVTVAASLALVPSLLRAEIDADNFSAIVTLTSDYVYRGVSQSRGDPAIQGGFDFEHEIGLFAGVWASSVQFRASPQRDSPRDLELDYYLGYRLDLGEDWAGDVTVTRYTYPGSDPAFHYDYGEIDLSVKFRDVLATSISYSEDVFGFGAVGIAYELTGRYPILANLEASAGVGLYDLEALLGESYTYWNLGLSRFLGRFTFTASYIDTDSRAATIWGRERSDGRLAVGVSAAIQ